MRDGQLQRDEEQRGRQRVAAAADVAQLVDQVEEREQHHQRDEDQQDRRAAPRGRCSGVSVFMPAALRSRAAPAEQPGERQLVAEQQQHDDRARSTCGSDEPGPEVELALRDHALHDVEAVAVEHVQERRGDQVERAAHPRIDVRRAGSRAAPAPAPRSAPRGARRARRARPRRRRRAAAAVGIALVDVGSARSFRGLDPAAQLVELDDPEVGACRPCPRSGGRRPAR